MKTKELTVTRIGNSRGVRLPAEVLRRYKIGTSVILEEHPDEIVLRPKRRPREKLAWAQTYRQMAQSSEDWSEWESLPEGLRDLPGDERKQDGTTFTSRASIRSKGVSSARLVLS